MDYQNVVIIRHIYSFIAYLRMPLTLKSITAIHQRKLLYVHKADFICVGGSPGDVSEEPVT